MRAWSRSELPSAPTGYYWARGKGRDAVIIRLIVYGGRLIVTDPTHPSGTNVRVMDYGPTFVGPITAGQKVRQALGGNHGS